MLMITDTPPDFDLRVSAALAAHGHPPLLVISRRTSRAWRYVSALLTVLTLAVLAVRFAGPVARLGRRMQGGYGHARSGLRAYVLLQAASLAFFWAHRHTLRDAGSTYAHDQMAGVAAWLAWRVYGVPYVYDAHEIVPFRARQTGMARMLLEFGWERAIVGASQRCVVVNRPMRKFYRRLYGPAHYEIRNNDFFPQRVLALASSGPRLVIYIGAAGKHRGLERMAGLACTFRARSLCFCSNLRARGEIPAGTEIHGLEGYEDLLLRRAGGAAPYMWCGFDTDVLSYRYALPNKFFQAMALGVPILATSGSYLGRLALRHGLGVVVDRGVDPWAPGVHEQCALSMATFRSAYRRGELSI
jgi:glycosyltransferase involved in cell wall biosynthesis